MKVLVTGGSGFVAPHLTKELQGCGFEVILTDLKERPRSSSDNKAKFFQCNLNDKTAIRDLVKKISPDTIIHLAGLSHVGQSFGNQDQWIEANVVATSHLCHAADKSEKSVVFLFISSAMVYDFSGSVKKHNELSIPRPSNPYGFSKLAAEYVVRTFASPRFKPYIVRPFNHIGPGQSRDFVCSGFAYRIMETPDNGEIFVGNLDSKRDFSDVRDIMRAYRLIVEKRPTQDLFVLGSGSSISIREILDHYIALSGKKIRATIDPNLLRPNDPADIIADASLAKKELGWRCEIDIKDSLRDIYFGIKKSEQ